MEIRISRDWKKKGYTISRVYVDGKRLGDGVHWCCALEDEDRGLLCTMSTEDIRKRKVYGKTAIPRGRYSVVVTYSPKFRKRLPLLENVRGFSGIRIHPLNCAKDSEGCIGFGVNDKVGWISDSRYWTGKVIALIEAALERKEKVTLAIGAR